MLTPLLNSRLATSVYYGEQNRNTTLQVCDTDRVGPHEEAHAHASSPEGFHRPLLHQGHLGLERCVEGDSAELKPWGRSISMQSS